MCACGSNQPRQVFTSAQAKADYEARLAQAAAEAAKKQAESQANAMANAGS